MHSPLNGSIEAVAGCVKGQWTSIPVQDSVMTLATPSSITIKFENFIYPTKITISCYNSSAYPKKIKLSGYFGERGWVESCVLYPSRRKVAKSQDFYIVGENNMNTVSGTVFGHIPGQTHLWILEFVFSFEGDSIEIDGLHFYGEVFESISQIKIPKSVFALSKPDGTCQITWEWDGSVQIGGFRVYTHIYERGRGHGVGHNDCEVFCRQIQISNLISGIPYVFTVAILTTNGPGIPSRGTPYVIPIGGKPSGYLRNSTTLQSKSYDPAKNIYVEKSIQIKSNTEQTKIDSCPSLSNQKMLRIKLVEEALILSSQVEQLFLDRVIELTDDICMILDNSAARYEKLECLDKKVVKIPDVELAGFKIAKMADLKSRLSRYSSCINVYIFGNATDTEKERSYLGKFLLPRLRSYATEIGISVNFIDTLEARNSIYELSQRNAVLESSTQTSNPTFFIHFVTDKFELPNFPLTLSPDEYGQIRSLLKEKEKSILDRLYPVDGNALSGKRFLNFFPDSHLTQAQLDQINEVFSNLCSRTEFELNTTLKLKQSPNDLDKFIVVRKFKDFDQVVHDAKKSVIKDIPLELYSTSKQGSTYIAGLRDRVTYLFKPETIFNVTIPWINGGITLESREHIAYIRCVSASILTQFRHFVKNLKPEIQTHPFLIESIHQAQQIKQIADLYIPSNVSDPSDQVISLLRNSLSPPHYEDKVFCVYGASGKTSTLARVAWQLQNIDHPCFVISMLLDSTVTLAGFLKRACYLIYHTFEARLNYRDASLFLRKSLKIWSISDDLEQIKHCFWQLLEISRKDNQLIFIVDGCDEIASDKLDNFCWIPQYVPSHTRIVFSTRDPSNAPKKMILARSAVETGLLNALDSEIFIRTLLERRDLKFDALKWKLWLEKNKPPFTTSQLSLLAQAPSNSLVSKLDTINSTLYQSVKVKHGHVVDFITSTLLASYHGMVEVELWDILSTRDELLDLHTSANHHANDQEHILQRFPSIKMSEILANLIDAGIIGRYLATDGYHYYRVRKVFKELFNFDQKKYHTVLSRYYSGQLSQEFPDRGIDQQFARQHMLGSKSISFHCVFELARAARLSENWTLHAKLLCDLHFINLYLQGGIDGVESLFKEYDYHFAHFKAVDCDENISGWLSKIEEFHSFLKFHQTVLQIHPRLLLPMAYNSSKESLLSRAAISIAAKNESFWGRELSKISTKWIRLSNRPRIYYLASKVKGSTMHSSKPYKPFPLGNAMFSTDGLFVLLCGKTSIKLVDLELNTVTWEFNRGASNCIFSSLRNTAYAVHGDSLTFLNTIHGTFEFSKVVNLRFAETLVTSVASSKSKNYPETIAIGLSNGVIQLFNEAGQELNYIYAHSQSVTALSWENGTSLASASLDGTVTIWDLEPISIRYSISHHKFPINTIKWLNSALSQVFQSLLAVGSDEGQLSVWDISEESRKTPVLVEKLEITTGYGITAVAWSNDFSIIAFGDRSGVIRLWNWKICQIVHTLLFHNFEILSLNYDNNGVLESASSDGLIHIWKTFDTPESVLKDQKVELPAPVEEQTTLVSTYTLGDELVAFSSDGKMYKCKFPHEHFVLFCNPPITEQRFIAASSTLDLIVTSSSDGSFIYIWKPSKDSGYLVTKHDTKYLSSIFSADAQTSWSPTSPHCISCNLGMLAESVVIWNVLTLQYTFLNANSTCIKISALFSTAGDKVALLTETGCLIYSWSADPFKNPLRHLQTINGCWTLCGWNVASDQILLISAYHEKVARDLGSFGSCIAYSLEDCKMLYVKKHETFIVNTANQFASASTCKYSPDGSLVAVLFTRFFQESWTTSPNNGLLVIYDCISGNQICEFAMPNEYTPCSLFNWTGSSSLVLLDTRNQVFYLEIADWVFSKVTAEQTIPLKANDLDTSTANYIKQMLESSYRVEPKNVKTASQLSLEVAVDKDNALRQKTIQLQGITALFQKERLELQDMVQKGVEKMYQDTQTIVTLEAQSKDLYQKIEAIEEAKARIETELHQEQEYTHELEGKVKEMTLQQQEMLRELETCRCSIM